MFTHRHLPVIALALLLAVAAGCSEQAQAPTAVLSGTDLSAAKKVVDNSSTGTFTQVFFNACEGEGVFLEGTFRSRVTVWDNGHSKIHLNVKAEGTGLDTGVKYNAMQQNNLLLGPGGLPGVFEVRAQLISATDVDNFFITIQFHVSENGDVTVDEPLSFECHG